MPSLVVVLVDPKSPGNVGAVARAMANFGLRDLVQVAGCPLEEEAFRRAVHAGDVLERARRVGTLDEARGLVDLAVGTTAVPGRKEEAFHRHALSPGVLADKLAEVEGTVGLFLGREDEGLHNRELARLDLVVHVPTDPAYPTLNVSHAAAILFYALTRDGPADRRRLASGFEREKLHEAFREFLAASGYPAHKRRRTEVLFRHLTGRALPSKWEFHALMGVFRRATRALKRRSESPG